MMAAFDGFSNYFFIKVVPYLGHIVLCDDAKTRFMTKLGISLLALEVRLHIVRLPLAPPFPAQIVSPTNSRTVYKVDYPFP